MNIPLQDDEFVDIAEWDPSQQEEYPRSTRKVSEKSIIPDLEKLQISDDIRNEAERIFQQLALTTKRGCRRKYLVFYCIFNAYKSLGQAQDPKTIAKLVGISTTKMSKASSMCSQVQTNYQPPIVFHTPRQFIPEYHRMVNLSDDCLDSILNLCDEIIAAESELLESNPQVVAAGVLMYYMTINGLTVNRKAFAKGVSLSEMTVLKMFKQISNIHNS